MPKLEAVAADSRASCLLTTARILAKVSGWLARSQLSALPALTTDSLPMERQGGRTSGVPDPGRIALLQYTSGSTAAPRGVMVSEENLWHNSACIARGFDHSAESVAVTWLPPFHDMGLIDGIVQPVYSGFPSFIMAPAAFLQRPARWPQAIARYRELIAAGRTSPMSSARRE